MGTLAGKTYEVQVDQGDGRWVVVDVHETRNASLQQAGTLLESGKYASVKVISEDERKGDEVIYEEVNENFSGKPITIVPVETAPYCSDFKDYFAFDSRRTIGRVLRNYLDHHTISALELMFDASMMRMLENSETLFPQAIQQIASAQTRGTDVKQADRVDELYKVATKVREEATEVASDITGYEILKEKGINALLTRMIGSHGEDKANYYIYQAFARCLRDGGDWNTKLEILSRLGKDDLTPEATSILDEVLAEILDGSAAVQELLGGQADLSSAIRMMIMVSQGRAKTPAHVLSCMEAVNETLHRLDLPLTKQVLLERVAVHLSGVRKLTKEEDKESERNALTVIIREVTDISGILGGEVMCGAITKRARISLSNEDEDLTFPDAMSRIINLIPNRAARIGYLAELAQSPVAEEYRALVLSELTKITGQVMSLQDLTTDVSPPAIINEAVEGLKLRLSSGEIPEECRDKLQKILETILSKPKPQPEAIKAAPPISNEEFKTMLSEKPRHKEVEKGEILFEEGEIGTEAYLIMDGEIDVFRRVGNSEHVIATLRKGEILGEMSLIDNQPRMASARIQDDSKLLVISQESLQLRLDRLQQEDRVMRRLVDTLVSRLRGEAQAGP